MRVDWYVTRKSDASEEHDIPCQSTTCRRFLAATFAAALMGMACRAPALAADAPAACIDVDSVPAKELENMKGIGPALSKRIIEFRDTQRTAATNEGRKTWNFNNWATLMKVPGISQKVCADNVSAVCFSGKVQKTCPAAT